MCTLYAFARAIAIGLLLLSRQDAKNAKVRIFAQSGEDDWAKPKGFKGDVFCLSSSPDKQKFNSLRPLRLCGE